MTARDTAEEMDRDDPLGPWRERFVTTDGLVYLDGNSLGMAPRHTLERLREVAGEEWAHGLIGSWDEWFTRPSAVGDRLAPIIGARPGTVIVHDSTTINLYQLVHAALALRPDRPVIAVDPGDFPTDRYVVDGIAAAVGAEVRTGFDDLDGVGVVVRSLVDYRTAELVDLATETARARDAGAVTVWDLSHAAGAVEVDLTAAGAELAVGCTYKFLCGGPGAPAFSYVAEGLVDQIAQPIWGWCGQHDQFEMGATYRPRDDIGRLLLGTPGILALAAAEVGIGLVADAGIGAIAAKGRALTTYGYDLVTELGLDSPTPADRDRRGAHLAVRVPDAPVTHRRLVDTGIVTDMRRPDVIRLGLSPLTTRFVDVHDGVTAIAAALAG